jgi:hypothetical protein
MKRNPSDLTIVRAAIAALIGSALVFWMPGTARAELLQLVRVVHQNAAGQLTEVADTLTTATGQIPSRDLLAQINLGSGRGVSSAAGRFGDVGASGFFTQGQVLETFVTIISEGENFNLLGTPQRAEAFFIIDGGSMSLIGGVGSTLLLDLGIEFRISDPFGPDREVFFHPTLTLEATSGGRTFTARGDDIGATFTRDVTIPLSFHSIDLGFVPPGGNIDIAYLFSVHGDVVDFIEGMRWEWSDPLDVSGTGAFPTIRFASVAVVPEPSSLALAILGMFGLLGYRWRPLHRACTNAKAA